MRSAPSIPSRSSSCHGQIEKASKFGHGMCQKMAVRASGRSRLMRLGKSAKW